MYRWFERYFALSRRELTGICVLGIFLFAIGLFPMVHRLFDASGHGDMIVQMAEIEDFLATVEVRKSSTGQAGPVSDHLIEYASAPTYFPFDPNGLAVIDWKRLGLSDVQIRMIKNYEAKGGRFRKKEDLGRIYAIHEADYQRLAPYIRIPEEKAVWNRPTEGQRVSEQVVEQPIPAIEPLLLELNSVDSMELQALPGIGPVFASRVVRFRNGLGGFHDIGQLLDVYGFDSLRFMGLREHVYVDTSIVSKIALNVAGFEQLRAHPLISPKLANAIVQYRNQHGPYRSLDDLLRIAIMDEGIFRKIAPYLTIVND